jgi:hypothetical protein
VEDKIHAPDPLARRGTAPAGTARVLLGEAGPPRTAARAQHLVNRESNGRGFDIISGTARPSAVEPTIPEVKGYWRHAHPSLSSVHNPLGR